MPQFSSSDPASSAPASPAWHTLSAAQIAQILGADAQGLSAAQAQERLAAHGSNSLPAPPQRGALLRFALQFHNVLLYVMLASAVVTALLGHWVDTGVLFAAVVVNAVIGFIQEGKAESALNAIRAMLSPHAIVLRDGVQQEIDATELVPGDLVLLASGDRVPADLRLLTQRQLRVDESALTGESVPAEKDTAAVAADALLGDRCCMAYSGTLVVYGQAKGVVVATGSATELGQVNQLLSGIQSLSTPLLRQVDHFGRVLALAILGVAVLTFALGTWVRGYAAADMFMMVVALVASAIPEGLPAIMTVTLALGVQRMARRHAIVRSLPAVEALGSVTVICSDKTGTLTRNEMTVQRVVCAGHVFDVAGVGYAPVGGCSLDGRPIDAHNYPALEQAVRAGVLCNDAHMSEEAGVWSVVGDPTEGALLVLGGKMGFSQEQGEQGWHRKDAIPFESQHCFMATLCQDSQGAAWIFAKGAPERMWEMCRWQLTGAGAGAGSGEGASERPVDVDYWRRMASKLAAQGLRLLVLACKRADADKTQLGMADMESGFVLLALVGIIDPPREEAMQAVRECHYAGISVKMITGDHAETARVIGAQLGIGTGLAAVTGAEVALMDDAALRRVVMTVDVFARASPEHKLRLVQALQENQQVVAMTGDGVNDAPALKRADVGVAMGKNGTDAAKQASDMVLTDDNFATIAAAVREGRSVYDNLKKFVLFILPTSGGQVLMVVAAILFALPLPLTPAQVLWINMVTASTLGLALAFEPANSDLMRRAPRPPDEALLSGFFVWRLVLVSVLMMTGALGLFLWEVQAGRDMSAARTLAVNAVVVAEMFYLVNSRFILAPALTRQGLLGNPKVLWALIACALLQWAFTYMPLMQNIFDTAALTLQDWGKVLGVGLLVFLGAELEKFIIRRTPVAARITH